MFGFLSEPTALDKEIARVTRELDNWHPTSDEYVELLERLTKLHKLKHEETASHVSKDTALLAATNLLGILMVIRHEHVNVITSRAMGMIKSPK